MSLSAISQIALWIICVANLLLVLVLYRHFGLSAMASASGHDNDGVPIGKSAPPVFLEDLAASMPAAEKNLVGEWTLLLFATPHCAPCVDAMETLERSVSDLASSRIRVLAAVTAKPDAFRKFRDEKAYSYELLLDPDGVTSVAWLVKSTPFVFLVDDHGSVRSKALASSEARLSRFVEDAVRLAASPLPRSVVTSPSAQVSEMR